ncbi:MAG TPA: 16S rRNA (guanine(527)-N(7))-methyltransferase RsmG [Rubrivivax sp.]|nr:16S rRNA (guanine(527)-N(7))-methyltransferase RsmG [Rubrivivax sp.]
MSTEVPASSPATTLREGAVALGLPLSDAQVEGLLRYLTLIQKWNRVYNLTSLRDATSIVTHHLLDSLAILPSLRQRLHGPVKALDVGSGAGLPGIVLGLMNPGWAVTCVDAVGKKASFIQQAAVELRLPNVKALHTRVEDYSGPPQDLAVSRAFATLAAFCAMTRNVVASDGRWAAMKGKLPVAEMAELPAFVRVFHVEHINVPALNAERCLVWMEKNSDAPEPA